MPIETSEILLRLAGGAGNTDPHASFGGVMSTSTVIVDNSLHNLFPVRTGQESTDGNTDYSSFYILNNDPSITWIGAKIWVESETSHAGEDFELSKSHEGLNATMETIADKNTAPVGGTINFVDASGEGSAVVLGDIPAGQRFGIWVKRTTAPGTLVKDNYTIVVHIAGDTTEA